MLPLMEMMLKSQNGDAFLQLQKQFGLNAEQTEQALGAVLPAFSTGLKRNAAAPKDFGAFMETLSQGRHEKYVDDPKAAFSDKGVSEGNGILGHLFGSKDASRAIATHAAGTSGVGENIIKKMLPVIASMVMGGISKQSTGKNEPFGISPGQNTTPANALGGGILGQILGELVKGGIGGTQRSRKSGTNNRQNNPLGDILDQMMKGGSAKTQRGRRQNSPFGDDNPLGQIFEEMLSGKRDNYRPDDDNQYQRRQPEPSYNEPDNDFEDIGSAERYTPKRRQRNPAPQKRSGGFDDLFGDMFETGRDVDEGYQRGVESIFDKFMKR